jgi:hypothetical protein
MTKLNTWEKNNHGFHPKVSAVSCNVSVKPAAAKNVGFINYDFSTANFAAPKFH